MNSKYRLFLVLVALSTIVALSALASTPALAEPEPESFQYVKVEVYPEYDDTRLLVMVEGDVAGVDIPATVRFLVPADAEMYSAGSKDALDVYTGGPPRREASSLTGWDEISYEVTEETFRMEYYTDLIQGDPAKTIAFEYHFLYPVSDMTVVVQEPYASTGFSVVPQADNSYNDGTFNVHQYSFTDLEKDEAFSFDISYNRLESRPSMAILGGGSANGATSGSSNTGLIAIAVMLAMAGGGGVVFLMMRSKQQQQPAVKRVAASGRKSKQKPVKRVAAPDAGGKRNGGPASKFCTQCGQTVDKSHRFCPSCGSEVY